MKSKLLKSIAYVMVTVSTFLMASSMQVCASEQTNALEANVIQEVNLIRESNGLPGFTTNTELTNAATIRSMELSTLFSHKRPDGSEWSTVSNLTYAENLALEIHDADAVINTWMESPSHMKNIVNADFKSMAVKVYIDSEGIVYWAQEFGY